MPATPPSRYEATENLNRLLEETVKADVTTKAGLVHVGCCLCQGASMFDDAHSFILEARRRNGLSVNAEDHPKTEQTRLYNSYVEAAQILPKFRAIIDTLTDTSTSILFYHEIRITNLGQIDRFRQATKKLGENGAPALNRRTRDQRGINHDLTGRLLCPITLDWDNEGIRRLVRELDPKYHPSSSLFSRCFYQNYTGNPHSLLTGFLRSPLLVRGYIHLYLGATNLDPNLDRPATELEPVTLHKDCLAKKLNLEKTRRVTPRTIAYTAVLIHLNLQKFTKWNPPTQDGYCYHLLYNFIVDFFEQPVGPLSSRCAQDLLEWWTVQVYGPKLRTFDSLQQSAEAFNHQLEDLEDSQSGSLEH
ncbi:hypothetical protein BDN72DRAFT_894460 [Pluteus cervinus]|uniref:Uncharacterized protein n=1 Tax=Pluteus cervinus TaxID=181527 RepID=A0ACD3B757_9AGAR|nr:hypothetical protein BDN72DRAFT_894460 [Pluteus cervinus]